MVARLNLISAGLSTHLVFHSLMTTRVSKVKSSPENKISGLVGRGEGSSPWVRVVPVPVVQIPDEPRLVSGS